MPKRLGAETSVNQDQDQDSLLVKRRNDNHSPRPVIRELVPSSHQRNELSNTVLCIFSRWDQRIGEGIPIPDSLGEEVTFINICISNGSWNAIECWSSQNRSVNRIILCHISDSIFVIQSLAFSLFDVEIILCVLDNFSPTIMQSFCLESTNSGVARVRRLTEQGQISHVWVSSLDLRKLTIGDCRDWKRRNDQGQKMFGSETSCYPEARGLD